MHRMNSNTQYYYKNSENFINEIKQKLSFDDIFSNPKLLSDLGISLVELDKAKSSVNSKQYHLEDAKYGNSRIVIYPNNTGNRNGIPFFTNQTNDSDRGDVFQFVKNRCENPLKTILEATNNLNGLIEVKEREKTIKPVKAFVLKNYLNKGLFNSYETLENEQVNFLVNSRGITYETLSNSLFHDKVMLYNPIDGKQSFFNAFFPKTNVHNEILGAEIKFPNPTSTGMKDMVEGDPLLLWHSNIPSNTSKVVLVESALDALSHFQIHQDTSVFYVSSNGNLYDKRIDSFYQLLEDFKINKSIPIVLANDNDYAGFTYDLRMLNHAISHYNGLFSVEKLNDNIVLKFHSQSENVGRDLFVEVANYFEKIKIGINDQILSEKYQAIDFVKLEKDNGSVKLIFSNEEFQKHHRKLSFSLFKGLNFIQKNTFLKVQRPPISTTNSIKDWNDYSKKLIQQKFSEQKQSQKRTQSNSKSSSNTLNRNNG